jgi:NADH:ubiquinone oxidoreductase subunit
MSKISIFGILSNVQMLLFTACSGKRVGTDQFGNVYYRGKPRGGATEERRWVMYASAPDASKIPPEWHGWIHHQTDTVPDGASKYRQPWQKPPVSNKTGTDQAYFPPGVRGKRESATADYVAWQPPK